MIEVVLLDVRFHNIEHILELDKRFKFITTAPKTQRYACLEYKQVTPMILYSEIKTSDHKIRVIIKKLLKNYEDKCKEHYFITNIFDISMERVLELYRKRWVIKNSLFSKIKTRLGYIFRVATL